MFYKSTWTLADQYQQLLADLTTYELMVDITDDEDQNHQADLMSEMEQMCQELVMIEELMFLKYTVDCDCFYTGKEHQ